MPPNLGLLARFPIGKCLLIGNINMRIMSIWSPMPFDNLIRHRIDDDHLPRDRND